MPKRVHKSNSPCEINFQYQLEFSPLCLPLRCCRREVVRLLTVVVGSLYTPRPAPHQLRE